MLRRTLQRRVQIYKSHLEPATFNFSSIALNQKCKNIRFYSNESQNPEDNLATQHVEFMKKMQDTPHEGVEESVNLQATIGLPDASFATEFVNLKHKKGLRIITLTRPKALNALNHEMVQQLHPIYRAYNSDPTTKTIVLKSDGRAFCAGGDIVNIVQNKDPTFFADEYKLDQLII